MSKVKITPMKAVVGMLVILIIAMYASSAIYYSITPKVYAMKQHKGRIAGQVYDSVIPKDAISDDGTVYFVSTRETVVGERYKAYSREVIVLAEENGQVAIYTDSTGEELLIVLAHDGEIKNNGDVIVFRP